MSINAKVSLLEGAIHTLSSKMNNRNNNNTNINNTQQHQQDGNDEEEYQDKLIRRTQLQMLKENVELIDINLEKLVVQTNLSPLTTVFDRVAIQSVIDEAGTLLILLNADDTEEEDDDDENEYNNNTTNTNNQFSNELQQLDAEINALEEENIATEEMIANIEYLSLFQDDSIAKLNEKYVAINVDPAVQSMTITPENFNSDDLTTRPLLWKEIRMKRLLIKEYVLKLEGTLEDIIIENRKNALAVEEVLMVQELSTYGRLLNLTALASKVGGIEQAAVYVTRDNFDANSSDLRPFAWRSIRLRRVMVQEDFQTGDGGSSNTSSSGSTVTLVPMQSELELARTRPRRVIEEEKMMLNEVLTHGQILSYGHPQDNPQRTVAFNDINNTTNNNSNNANDMVRARANTIRLRANTMRDRAYTIREKETYTGGRSRVISSAPIYRNRAATTFITPAPNTKTQQQTVVTSAIEINCFDPDNDEIRPTDWLDIRMKRVMAKERDERQLQGMSCHV